MCDSDMGTSGSESRFPNRMFIDVVAVRALGDTRFDFLYILFLIFSMLFHISIVRLSSRVPTTVPTLCRLAIVEENAKSL